jgi:hypothetical protein
MFSNRSPWLTVATLVAFLFKSVGCSIYSDRLDEVMLIEDEGQRLDAFIQLRDSLPAPTYLQARLLEDAVNAFNGTEDVVLKRRISDTGKLSLHLCEQCQPYPERLDQITDISVFTGMAVESFSVQDCPNLRDFEPLGSMSIRRLNLDGCDGFRFPSTLNETEGLTSVVLSNTGSGSPMRWNIASLDRLDLGHSHMVKFLRGLKGKSIGSLSLDGLERISDFSPLSEIRIDESLSLNGTAIDDLAPLKNQRIRHLSLNGCKNLRSLAGLETMPQLQSVSLLNTHVAPAEVQRLKQRLPRLSIAYNPPPASVVQALSFDEVMQIQDPDERLRAFITLRDSMFAYSPQQTDLIRRAINAFNDTQGVDLMVRRLDDGTKTLHLRGNGFVYPEKPHPTDAITDISPFTGMAFELLDLTGMKKIEDFSTLKTMRLKSIQLKGCRSFKDTSVLDDVEGLESYGIDSTGVKTRPHHESEK